MVRTELFNFLVELDDDLSSMLAREEVVECFFRLAEFENTI